MNKDVFKIEVRPSEVMGRRFYQAEIRMSASVYVMRISIESHLDRDTSIRLMKAELKQEMIKAILDTEWKMVDP